MYIPFYYGVIILKKVVIGFFVLIMTITTTFMLLGKKTDESLSGSTEEKFEINLIKSMEETKKEKIKIEELLTKIPQEVNDEGYGQIALSFSPDDRVLTVQATDQEFVKRHKTDVETLISTIAKELEFQNFDVNFITLDSYGVISQHDNKLNELLNEVLNMTSDLLKEQGYGPISISINPKKEIMIEGTNEDLVNKNEMEKLIANIIFSKTNMDFTVTIKEKSKSQIREQEWLAVFSAITEETQKEFEEYKGFAYSFHPEPLQIIIKTNMIKPKWFWKSDKKVKQIANYVDKIIELKRKELSIEEIPYQIIITNKNNKKIHYNK